MKIDNPDNLTAIVFNDDLPFTTDAVFFPEYPKRYFLLANKIDQITPKTRIDSEDLRASGWVPFDPTDKRFTLANSQLADILYFDDLLQHPYIIEPLSLDEYGKPTRLPTSTYWIREAHLRYADQYPVLLVGAIPPSLDLAISQCRSIGADGFIVQHEKRYRYSIEQLGEEGKHYLESLGEGFTHLLRKKELGLKGKQDLESLDEEFANLLRKTYPGPLPSPYWVNRRDTDPSWEKAQEAARKLASLYYHYHQRVARHSLSDIPSVNNSGIFSLPAQIALQGILGAYSNAQSGAAKWKNLEQQRLAYLYSRSGNVAQVELRPTDIPIATLDTMMESMLQRLRQFSDLDGDVLLAILAQWMEAPRDEGGYIWISIDRIQEYRGVQPRIYKASDKTEHPTTHRKDVVVDINTSIKHIRDTHVIVRQWMKEERPAGKRGRPKKQVLQQESYILNIADFLRYQSLPEEAVTTMSDALAIAWRCRPGECLEGFLEGDSQVAGLLQQTLSYDPYHELWEKRLARYFTFHEELMRGGKILCEIRGLLTELSLDPKPNQSDPQKIKRRFDKAMDRLRDDKQISDWQYLEDENILPSHKWLERWMDFHIDVTARSFNRISKTQKGRNRNNGG